MIKFLNGLQLTVAVGLLTASLSVQAVNLSESGALDFSNSGSNPTLWSLTYGTAGANGSLGNNILSGSTGRVNGVVDRDYLHVQVPQGYIWSELRVGTQTTASSATGAFIALGAGDTMLVSPSASSAAGLLGWKHYNAGDHNTDILDDMASSGQGASGFVLPLGPGSYTLWIQELASGNFPYRFNAILSPIPEPTIALSLLAGLGVLGFIARTRRPA